MSTVFQRTITSSAGLRRMLLLFCCISIGCLQGPAEEISSPSAADTESGDVDAGTGPDDSEDDETDDDVSDEAVCGDAFCDDISESCSSCPSDCICDSTCGDGVCGENETCDSCESDCGECATCGNGVCDSDEDSDSCPEDCEPVAACGDGVCGAGESCDSCAVDCGACAYCGDGVCNGLESCSDCASDCGVCPPDVVTVRLSPSDDSYVNAASPGKNFGGKPKMYLQPNDTAQTRRGVMRFNISDVSGDVLSATLYVTHPGEEDFNLLVDHLEETEWDESTVTWNNRPSDVLTSLGPTEIQAGAQAAVDVSSIITGNGAFTLQLRQRTLDEALDVAAKEGAESNQPYLELVYENP